MDFISKLTEARLLKLSFIATFIITVTFPVVVKIWGLVLLDGISDPEQARLAIDSMSTDQRIIHAWMTGTLDVLYPIAYGSFFIGSANRFFPKLGFFLALPTFLLIPIDLIEGVIQIFALTNTADWLPAKAYLTPVKKILFFVGLVISIYGCTTWIFNHFSKK